ncbi:magnesium and cobalt transporter CorA [Paenisporosarcina sp. HGH0030]|uniref:magnesium/cobalt transporter CorA n=1 Tax=Paenisporosarcina sp. HGH0030 TaxID=1078085 RepID=UPI00034E92DC|nr:magnesium/cobalt transporter CorA [Paenisporosarcina sp. HGH0030]EPD49446.1 magnesium and cobalt transporter CorA [Paenisporosarcina sp. HGH0030]
MIRTFGVTADSQLEMDFPLEDLHKKSFDWYWIDFDKPSATEWALLDSFFHFHPLAIEDCLHRLQRPKVDYHDGYHFFVVHTLNEETLEAEELDLFVGKNFVVTFHHNTVQELDLVREKLQRDASFWERGAIYAMYQILDKVVDSYFPLVYKIEDHLNEIEDQMTFDMKHFSMDTVFEMRSDLLWLRRTILPMRDLMYRVLNSSRFNLQQHEHSYFADISDHLVKLTEIVESNRELTADIRDSYMAMNSNRMNRIMMILTIVSSIFIPLTFVAGVYGMNFENMPELETKYGYFFALGGMALIGLLMFAWFKYKGWLNLFKS